MKPGSQKLKHITAATVLMICFVGGGTSRKSLEQVPNQDFQRGHPLPPRFVLSVKSITMLTSIKIWFKWTY